MNANRKINEGYVPSNIEAKWQAKWQADGLYDANIDPDKPKHYALTMLPYPSGDLHIGHWYAMTPSDARARFMRMNGFNVMFPIGFDAFGLPAENAAIKNKVHPKQWTYKNIDLMRAQLRSMGAMWDWRREAISVGRNGSSLCYLKTGWHIANCPQWTFALIATPHLHVNRSGGMTGIASAAKPRSSRRTLTSGFFEQHLMQKNCSIIPEWIGRNVYAHCKPIGSAKARVLRSSS